MDNGVYLSNVTKTSDIDPPPSPIIKSTGSTSATLLPNSRSSAHEWWMPLITTSLHLYQLPSLPASLSTHRASSAPTIQIRRTSINSPQRTVSRRATSTVQEATTVVQLLNYTVYIRSVAVLHLLPISSINSEPHPRQLFLNPAVAPDGTLRSTIYLIRLDRWTADDFTCLQLEDSFVVSVRTALGNAGRRRMRTASCFVWHNDDNNQARELDLKQSKVNWKKERGRGRGK